ncbi:Ribokinase-like protein [Globomyces pollinis-pini]|nr:Ribokinase-like protein [Globomyces pollinis-pini]
MRKTPNTSVPITQTREILVIGLNPAFQSTLHFNSFKVGKVNRASRKCNSVGGKGQNFAIACSQYGEADKITILQALGGMTGRCIQDYLDELHLEHVTVPISKTTRTCTTVLDKSTGETSELIEPAGRVEISEKQIIEQTAKQLITNSPKLEAIALCGTLPPGLNGSTYSFITQLKPQNCVVLLDAFQNIECLSSGKVNILKINSEESRKLTGYYDDSVTLVDVGKTILRNYKLPILAITDGPSVALLFELVPITDNQPRQIKVTRYHLPALDVTLRDLEIPQSPSSQASSLPEATGEAFQPRVGSTATLSTLGLGSNDLLLNPLGAGDTCSAIFLLEYLDTRNAALAFKHGLAAASASCLMIDTTSHFDIPVKDAIFDQINTEFVIIDYD